MIKSVKKMKDQKKVFKQQDIKLIKLMKLKKIQYRKKENLIIDFKIMRIKKQIPKRNNKKLCWINLPIYISLKE